MACLVTWPPEQKIGVVIFTNKFLGGERIELGRDTKHQLIMQSAKSIDRQSERVARG